MHDDGLLPAALRIKEGLPVHLRSFETITMSLLQREGQNSTSFMLFLLSLDFGHAWRRQHENSLNVNKDSWTTSILTVESQLAWAGALWLKQPGRR